MMNITINEIMPATNVSCVANHFNFDEPQALINLMYFYTVSFYFYIIHVVVLSLYNNNNNIYSSRECYNYYSD